MTPGELIYLRMPHGGPLAIPVDDASFVADARAVINLPEERVEALHGQLADYAGFLAYDELDRVVESVISEKPLADQLSHFISALNRVYRNSRASLETFFSRPASS